MMKPSDLPPVDCPIAEARGFFQGLAVGVVCGAGLAVIFFFAK